MEIKKFQELIGKLYWKKDRQRGKARTLLRLGEELGELYEAHRKGDREAIAEELADLVAWAASYANLEGIKLERAVEKKYPNACHYCGSLPCKC